MTDKKNSNLIICILMCAAISALCFIGATVIWGAFTLRDDFNRETLTFMRAMRLAIPAMIKGEGEWLWNLDLGTSLVQGFSYYNLGSPFTWLTLLFPASMPYPAAAGFMNVLKFTAAGAFSFLYLRRISVKDRYALIGALLYAFSGFQGTNLIYHFHDSVALFPLLMIGAERKLAACPADSQGSRGASSVFRPDPVFIIAVFLCALTNYFFFMQECVFLLLYVAARAWKRDKKEAALILLSFLADGILGACMAGVLLLPSALYILGNNRGNTGMLSLSNLIADPRKALFLLKSILMPADVMSEQSAIYTQEYSSASVYLPLIGPSLAAAYVARRLKASAKGEEKKLRADWLSAVLCILAAASFSPLLSSAFTLFSADYRRWWFMAALMMAAASARVLEDRENYPVKKSALFHFGLAVLVYIVITLLRDENGAGVIYRPERLLILFLIAAEGYIFLVLFEKKERCGLFLAAATLTCLLTTCLSTAWYHSKEETTERYMQAYETGMHLYTPDDQYRFRLENNELVLTGDAAGYRSFCSTISNSVYEFDSLYDYYDGTMSFDLRSYPGLPELFGVKYWLVPVYADTSPEDPLIKNALYFVCSKGALKPSEADRALGLCETEEVYAVIEQKACPIGFPVDAFVTRHDLRYNVKFENYATVMMYAAVVEDKDADRLVSCAQRLTGPEVDFTAQDIYMDAAISRGVKEFARSRRGFTCMTDYGKEQAVWFSVPYDRGWTCIVDQTPVEITDSAGMMLVVIPEGLHRIEFVYSAPGLKEGAVLTIAGCLVFAALCMVRLIRMSRARRRTS